MTPPGHPPLNYCEIEDRHGVLVIRMRNQGSYSLEANWWTEILTRCPGPYQGLWIDLFGCSVVSSSFFAGALQLIDHYRNDQLTTISLLNASDRIVRLIDIMNLSGYFTVRPLDRQSGRSII